MDFLDNKIYYPMLISEKGIDQQRPPEEYNDIWKKYIALPQVKQDILADAQLPMKIKSLQDSFHLGEDSIWRVSLIIRQIFFGELSLEQAEAKIGAMLTETGEDPNQARAIVEFIQNEILTIQPKPKIEETQETEYEEEKPKATALNLPLLQALSRYEQLGQQVITSEKIKLKTQIEPVRPSLVNWLKYYRDELGIGQHSSVERGEFLFRSENCRKLSGEERERISLILKSVEEYLPIAIDAERQEIIFPKFQVMPANFDRRPNVGLNTAGSPAFPSVAPNSQEFGRQSLPTPARSNAGSVSFSSGHTLPAEKEEPNSFRIRPMTNKE